MNKKGLAILLRTRMRGTDPNKLPISPVTVSNRISLSLSLSLCIVTQLIFIGKQNEAKKVLPNSESFQSDEHFMRLAPEERDRISAQNFNSSINQERELKLVQESMHSAITLKKTEVVDAVLENFSEGYFTLSHENRRKILVALAKEYDVSRNHVREIIQQYLRLEVPGDKVSPSGIDEEGSLSVFYRTERNLRHALKPMYEVLFERLNTHPGGLKFLTILRADLLSILAEENTASLRSLDSYLKEKLITWLSPATIELHCITWDDPASLLEKIVAYEAVHPISNLIDLKRRLGVGRRCFGYIHPAIPAEPLVFIEVALLKNVAQTIQEVLWDDPSKLECEATCALFYSISSTQPGLAGINLGKFLIKRVVELLKREMPHISTFATLSPIPGFMQWLLSKLASQLKLSSAETEGTSHSSGERLGSTFRENILQPEEERALLDSSMEFSAGKNGMEVMWNLLTSTSHEWINSHRLLPVLQAPLMRLCVRYLLQEKKRGKALDAVANFHLQNGAMIERLNWMADRSEKGLHQSGGIMVNYIYRLDEIEENAQSYFSTGHIQSSRDLHRCLEQEHEERTTV